MSIMDAVPNALKEIRLRRLFAMRLQVAPATIVGQTPSSFRRVTVVTGGQFESDREGLSGHVKGTADDWQTVRPDNTTTLDVRLVLETTGGDLITMVYKGYRHGEPATLARLDRGEDVDPSEYYFRSAPFFETASKRFDWLNHTVAIATGHRFPDGPLYNVFEVL
jgi:hypothetical protein